MPSTNHVDETAESRRFNHDRAKSVGIEQPSSSLRLTSSFFTDLITVDTEKVGPPEASIPENNDGQQ